MNLPPPLPPPIQPGRRRRGSEYLWLNLSFPGVGSYQAGWRVSGIIQACLAALGFGLTNLFAFWFCRLWYRSGEFPITTLLREEIMPASWMTPFLTGLVGGALFVLAFGWAFLNSLLIMRAENLSD